jgi:hypothetical protein
MIEDEDDDEDERLALPIASHPHQSPSVYEKALRARAAASRRAAGQCRGKGFMPTAPACCWLLGVGRCQTRDPLVKPCFACGVFRCQVSGVRKNHTMLRLPET